MNFDLHDMILGGGIGLIGLGVWHEFGLGYAGIVTGGCLLLLGLVVLIKGS